MDLVKKPCSCRDGYVSAAAGDEPPCTCVPTVRLQQPGDAALWKDSSDVHPMFESPLRSFMTAYLDVGRNLPTEIIFQCSEDTANCLHKGKLHSMDLKSDWRTIFDSRLDHTKCFHKKYVKEYQFYYRVKKLVIGSSIDLRVLLGSSIFENLIELELLDRSHIAEIPDEVYSILESLQSLNVDRCPIKKLPSLSELTKLSCTGCKDLSELPNLPELLELNSSSCKSLSKLPNLPKLLKLDCALIPSLVELPDGLLDLKRLNCSGTGLRNIPLLKHLKFLECRQCTNLTEISESPELIHLDISFTKVEKLPQYPKLKTLSASDCLELSRLEPLPLLETLYIPGCVNLKDLPPLMNLIELFCNGSGFADIDTIDLKYMPKIKIIFTLNKEINFINDESVIIKFNKTLESGFRVIFIHKLE